MVHDVERGDEFEATLNAYAHVDFIFRASQLPLSDVPSFLECILVKFFVVVCFSHVLRLGTTLIVQKGCITIRVELIIFHVAKDVEEIFVVMFCVLNLIGQVVPSIAVCTTLSWLVSRVFLRAHGNHVFDPLLDNCS